MADQMARISVELTELERVLDFRAPAPMPLPPPMPMPPPPPPVWPAAPPPPPKPSLTERIGRDTGQGWIGKGLAVAGVAVTLIGVVLLLVLAAQAGILRPEIRVTAGAGLAAALVFVGVRMNRRPGGRVGAIALAATGIAAGYMDVIAVTTIYDWVPPTVGLLLASAIGGAGLTLARRWDSQHLGLLVFVPLIGLAPIVADGVTLLLVGFMIVLSAAALPVQLGKDWIWMHAARTVGVTVPLLVALLAASFAGQLGSADDPWLLGGACAVAALLSIVGGLILLPHTSRSTALAMLTVIGVIPALSTGIAVDRYLAALIAGATATVMLAIVVLGSRFPGFRGAVGAIWSALSAVGALIAVTVAFDGDVAGPVLLGLALTVVIAGRRSVAARWSASGFTVVGAAAFVTYAPPDHLVHGVRLPVQIAVSVLASSVLLAACAVAIARAWGGRRSFDDSTRMLWACAAVVGVYAITVFTVTTGVLIGGPDGGFLAGHMAATICWIAVAAGLFVAALRIDEPEARTAPIAGGLALTAAAMAKLFLFDLGTLDGMFRVAVFIVVGLVLLGMGAGYARSLASKGMPYQS